MTLKAGFSGVRPCLSDCTRTSAYVQYIVCSVFAKGGKGGRCAPLLLQPTLLQFFRSLSAPFNPSTGSPVDGLKGAEKR